MRPEPSVNRRVVGSSPTRGVAKSPGRERLRPHHTRLQPCTCAPCCCRSPSPSCSPFPPSLPAVLPWRPRTAAPHWTIPLPNPFGVVVENRTLSFNARELGDGSATGRFEYHQVVEGDAFSFNVDVTCMNVYGGNRAKIGGVIVVSNDPTLPPGTFAGSRSSTTARARRRRPTGRASSASATRPRTKRSATARRSPVSGPGTSRGTSRFGPSRLPEGRPHGRPSSSASHSGWRS